MEKKIKSCAMLTYEEWDKLKPLLIENGIEFNLSKGSKYAYVKFEVSKKQYDKIDELMGEAVKELYH